MSDFSKEALECSYSWNELNTGSDDTLFGPEDIIDRANGNQILDFINRFMKMNGLISLESFRRIEALLCRCMPQDITTRSEMKLWLSKNWNAEF